MVQVAEDLCLILALQVELIGLGLRLAREDNLGALEIAPLSVLTATHLARVPVTQCNAKGHELAQLAPIVKIVLPSEWPFEGSTARWSSNLIVVYTYRRLLSLLLRLVFLLQSHRLS